ncbi:MAG: collagen-like protein [Solirubrobacteraceae bacterium]|nr:collagen-like protein [Solirubrobacteraceae bacterium]
MFAISRLTSSVPGRIIVVGGVVFALGGGSATAAALITSKQIKDGTITVKDLSKATVKQLQGGAGANGAGGAKGTDGANGPAGPAGAVGPIGATGATGPQGVPGTPGAPGASAFDGIPSGTTIGGQVMIDDHGVTADDLIDTAGSFGARLPAIPTAKLVGYSQYVANAYQATDAECPGTTTNPQSAPGVLCLYVTSPINVKNESVTVTSASHRLGFSMRVGAAAGGYTQLNAVWSYKAA